MLGIGLFGMGTGPSIQHRVVEPGGPRRAARVIAARIGRQRGHRVRRIRRRGGDRRRQVSFAVITGAVIAVLAVVVAWATSVLKAPVGASAPDDAGARR